MIAFRCSECGARYDVSDELGGERIRCRECHAASRLPYTLDSKPNAALSMLCPKCSATCAYDKESVGTAIRCDDCGTRFMVPAPNAIPANLRVPSRKRPLRRPEDETPWFYSFLSACCSVAVKVIFICGGLTVAAGLYALGAVREILWVLLGTVAGVIGCLAGIALLMLLIDIGLTLRRLLEKTSGKQP